MDDETRSNYERDLAVAVLVLWLLFESLRSVRVVDFSEFGAIFNEHVRPILSRVYGMARNTLANSNGVNYPTRPDGNGGQVVSLPNLQTAMNRFQQTIWDSFNRRWDNAQPPVVVVPGQPPSRPTAPPSQPPTPVAPPVAPPGTSPTNRQGVAEPPEPEPLFDEADAERIAVTSVTEASSLGEMDAASDIESRSGVRMVAIWRAEPDACDECGPLNGTTRRVWRDPPPKHPNCRCALEWRPLI